MSETIWAQIAEIRISERAARGLSVSTVERYRQWLEQGRVAPPVRLARLGDVFVVRDGRHRIAAALAAGHTVIEAEVRPRARFGRWLMVAARNAVQGWLERRQRRSSRSSHILGTRL